MNTSKKLSDKRLKEIAKMRSMPDDENPELSDDDIRRFRFARESHPEWYAVKPVKQQITIKIDKDILEILKADGRGYQTRINTILREAVIEHGNKL